MIEKSIYKQDIYVCSKYHDGFLNNAYRPSRVWHHLLFMFCNLRHLINKWPSATLFDLKMTLDYDQFQFRRLNIGFDTVFPISITLFYNHLKCLCSFTSKVTFNTKIFSTNEICELHWHQNSFHSLSPFSQLWKYLINSTTVVVVLFLNSNNLNEPCSLLPAI